MDSTQIIIVVCVLAAIGLVSLWWSAKNAHDLDQEEQYTAPPKFQPRKVTVVVSEGIEKPKRKYYKRKNKKKKPTVAQTAQVEKRPVGRPKKSK